MAESIEELRGKIAEALKKRKSVTVYDNTLSGLWPPPRHTRAKQLDAIRQFAADNGWALKIRDQGLIAVFSRLAPTVKQ